MHTCRMEALAIWLASVLPRMSWNSLSAAPSSPEVVAADVGLIASCASWAFFALDLPATSGLSTALLWCSNGSLYSRSDAQPPVDREGNTTRQHEPAACQGGCMSGIDNSSNNSQKCLKHKSAQNAESPRCA